LDAGLSSRGLWWTPGKKAITLPQIARCLAWQIYSGDCRHPRNALHNLYSRCGAVWGRSVAHKSRSARAKQITQDISAILPDLDLGVYQWFPRTMYAEGE